MVIYNLKLFIMNFTIEQGDMNHSYVKWPEGNDLNQRPNPGIMAFIGKSCPFMALQIQASELI